MTRTQNAFSFGWTITNSATGVDTRHRNEDAEHTPPKLMLRLHGSSIEGGQSWELI
jgi:hypothetical protein